MSGASIRNVCDVRLQELLLKIKRTVRFCKKETVSYGSTSSDGNSSVRVSIDQLTEEKTVISYVKQNHKLPDYYITKRKQEIRVGILLKEIFVMYFRKSYWRRSFRKQRRTFTGWRTIL